MKVSRIISIVLILGGINILALSCAPKAATTTTTTQTVTVGRGNLSLSITSVGNLALSESQDVAFDVPGTVDSVLVNPGDSVKKGQVLATLDTTGPAGWDATITTYQRNVTKSQQQITKDQIALRNAQTAVITANNTVTSDQFALQQAQLDLQTANTALSQIGDVQAIQTKIDNATNTLNIAKGVLTGNFSIGVPITVDNYWTNIMNLAQTQIVQLKADMRTLVGGNNTTTSASVAAAIAQNQLNIEKAQFNITKAQLTLQTDQQKVDDAQTVVDQALVQVRWDQEDLKIAQQTLTDARSNSPKVTAPFDGFVTSVTAVGGTDVKKGAIAVTVADPTKFKAVVMVNETDISKVKLGQLATIVPQAASSTTYSANVTQVAPTATIQQGVVNYQVTVGVQSLEPVGQALRQLTGNGTSGATSGGPGGGRGQAPPGGGGGQGFSSGNLTQAQIQALQQRAQSAGANLTQAQISQAIQQRQQGGGGGGRQFQTSAASSSTSLTLAAGMTVTVTIPYDTRTDVVLVPNAAITTSAGQSSVKVVNADNTTAVRPIQTGIADSQNTEVISGLNVGEKVQITKTTRTGTGTTPTTTPGGGGIPGLGGGAFRVGG